MVLFSRTCTYLRKGQRILPGGPAQGLGQQLHAVYLSGAAFQTLELSTHQYENRARVKIWWPPLAGSPNLVCDRPSINRAPAPRSTPCSSTIRWTAGESPSMSSALTRAGAVTPVAAVSKAAFDRLEPHLRAVLGPVVCDEGAIPDLAPGEFFVWGGILAGITELGLNESELAVRYLITGFIVIYIRGLTTEWFTRRLWATQHAETAAA